MFGQPYNSGPQSYQKYAVVKGYPTSQVPVISTINGNLATILLLSAAAAAEFGRQFPVLFPDNPALLFDGKEYTFTHRDIATGNIIFEESTPTAVTDVNEIEVANSGETTKFTPISPLPVKRNSTLATAVLDDGEYTEDGVSVFIRGGVAVAVKFGPITDSVRPDQEESVRRILICGIAEDVDNEINFIPASADEDIRIGKNADSGINWPIGGDGESRAEVGEFPLCG